MGISDLAEATSTTRYFANGLLTKKRYTRKERRYASEGNRRANLYDKRELAKAQLETWHCFPHHDMLVRKFGRKAADYLGRRIRTRDDDLNLKSAYEQGADILAAAGVVNRGFDRRTQ